MNSERYQRIIDWGEYYGYDIVSLSDLAGINRNTLPRGVYRGSKMRMSTARKVAQALEKAEGIKMPVHRLLNEDPPRHDP